MTDNQPELWKPIEPLSATELAIDVSEFDSLVRVWNDAKRSLEKENPDALREFYEKLRRSWSVETGILENLYMLDRNTTQTLIDRGFRAELISRTSTDTDPHHLVDLLMDNLTASELLQGRIEDDRPLTLHFVRELQACITAHQDSVDAVDQEGNALTVSPQ